MSLQATAQRFFLRWSLRKLRLGFCPHSIPVLSQSAVLRCHVMFVECYNEVCFLKDQKWKAYLYSPTSSMATALNAQGWKTLHSFILLAYSYSHLQCSFLFSSLWLSKMSPNGCQSLGQDDAALRPRGYWRELRGMWGNKPARACSNQFHMILILVL